MHAQPPRMRDGPPHANSMLGAWALPKPRSNKEATPTASPHLATSAHHHLASPRLTCSPHGDGRLYCTATPRSSHISRRQLVYIKEKNKSFFLNRKSKQSDKNWLRKFRSKSTSWGRNMRVAASPLAGRLLSVLSVLSRLSRLSVVLSVLSGPEHDQQCLAQAPPNVNRL
jgi:hypothetical protein